MSRPIRSESLGPLVVEPSLRGVPRIEEFLRVIVANPESDEPRLVLSDWLRDQGQEERAELIRLQCRMVQLEEAGREWEREYQELERQGDALLERYAAEWKPGPELANCLFRRGLLETYRVENIPEFLEMAPRIFQQTTVQVLRLRRWGDFSRLLALAGLRWLYELDFPAGFSDFSSEAIRTLVRSLALRNLRIIRFANNWLRDEQIELLALAPCVDKLVRLDLTGHQLSSVGIRRMVGALSARLRELDLGGKPLGVILAGALREASHLAGLRTLLLDGCLLGPRGMQLLTQAPFWKGLKRLSLSSNRLGTEGVRTLLASASRGQLTWLDLDRNDITEEGALALAASGSLGALRFLSLKNNPLSPAGARALLHSPLAAGSTRIELDSRLARSGR